MKARELVNFLLDLEAQGHALDQIDVTYREHFDSDVFAIAYATEGLYDAETNNIVTSVVLAHRDDDWEDYA